MKKIAFLDRDGVINKEVNYLHRIEDFEFTYKCVDALSILRDLGYEFVVITNQAGIGKGYYNEEQYQTLTDYYLRLLSKNGIEILNVLHCPHHPEASIKKFKKECQFRKPNPGMVLKALETYDIDLEASILVGDKLSDLDSGSRAGLKKLYFVESGIAQADNLDESTPVFSDLFHLATYLQTVDRGYE